MDDSWEKLKTRERELKEKKRTVVEQEHNGGAKRKRRRMKYPLLGEDWGEEDNTLEQEDGEEAVITVLVHELAPQTMIEGSRKRSAV